MPQTAAILRLDPRVELACIGAAADDGEHGIVPGDLRRQLLPVAGRFQVGRQMDFDPLQRAVQPGHIIDDFTDFAGREAAQLAGLIETVAAFQRRLGGGAQHQRDAVILDQQAQHVDHRLQIGHRQQLCLVEHDDAADQVVQLAAARGAAGEQAFQQLHVGGDDQRGIPVFASQAGTSGFLLFVHLDIAVVLDDVLVAENATEDARRLLDDAGVGNGVDDPALAVAHRVPQRESQAGQCLAATGRHRQAEHARRAFRLGEAGTQHFGAFAIDLTLCLAAGCNLLRHQRQTFGQAFFQFIDRHEAVARLGPVS